MSAERDVCTVIETWAKAVSDGDSKAILAHHSEDMLLFDFPATVRGPDAYDRTWNFFFANPRGSISFVPCDMVVTADNEVAFVSCEMHCDGKSAGPVDFRLTTRLRKLEGEWVIVHDHHSVPTDHARLIASQ